jgi:hypothetical protein
MKFRDAESNANTGPTAISLLLIAPPIPAMKAS